MADSTSNITQILQSQSQKEATANGIVDALSPSSFYGRNAPGCAGLVWAYFGAKHYDEADSPPLIAIPNGTHTLTANNTCYIEHTSIGTPSFNTSGFTSGRVPDYAVLVGATTVTSWVDYRGGMAVAGGGGGGGSPTGAAGGDLTGTYPNPTVTTDAITNAKLANVATATFKGRTTGGTGDPEDLTVTQATALLNVVVGDSGSGGVKGLAPATGAGDAAAGKFLKADATWAVPASSSAMVVLSPAYGATVTVDLTSYTSYPIVVVNVGTLTGNITFNITNGADGQIIRARFTQDGTGSRIFSAGAALRFSADTPSPTLTTTASKMDRLAFEWHAGAGKADLVAINKGY